jgi:hypothetical protein
MATTINPSNQTITQYNIETGGASNLLNNVAPSSTSGVAVISQGASSQPIFGTVVVAGGGTGQTTLTNHGVLVGAGTSAVTQLATGSAGQVLQSGGASADPSYSTPTYPSTSGSAGVILRSDGTNYLATTNTYPNTATTGDILYASGSNVIGNLSDVATGQVLVSGGVGAIPAYSATPTVTSITFGTGNALSNYVSGTFTPAIAFGGSSTGVTYNYQLGSYLRIGNAVFFKMDISLSSKGSQTGNVTVTGFPITSVGTTISDYIPMSYYTSLTLTAGYTIAFLAFESNTTSPNLYMSSTGGSGVTNVTNTMFSNSTKLSGNGFYLLQ